MFQKDDRLQAAYEQCRKIATGHYENFPVASKLVPRQLRPHVYALYAFMRTADDFADLPHRPSEERLQLLSSWRTQLLDAQNGAKLDEPIFLALENTMRKFALDFDLLHRLLDAFEFDAKGEVHFDTFEDLHWYTQRSAEPVGQLVLALFGYHDDERIGWSNDICTALQLINFLQDAKDDLANGRCYFPKEDFEQFGIENSDKLASSPRAAEVVAFECDRIESLLEKGSPLPPSVDGRLRMELRVTRTAAHLMLKKIRGLGAGVFRERPKLSLAEKSRILLGASLGH